MYDQTSSFVCAYCGSENTVEVDISAGLKQEYYEDCEMCSRSNRITVTFDENNYVVHIQAETEF